MCVCVCGLSGAAAQAKVYDSYDDVLKSGDKAEIAAMKAAMDSAGYSRDGALLDDPPQVFVWFLAPSSVTESPPRYLPYANGGTIVAGAYPEGGSFAWSCSELSWSASGSSPSVNFAPTELGTYSVHVEYTVEGRGSAQNDSPDIIIYACNLTVEDIEDDDPQDPANLPDAELDPGALIAVDGARRQITLNVLPAGAFPESEPDDGHCWSLTLSASPSGPVEFWDAAEDGNEVTTLGWVGEYGPWHGDTIPSTLHVQGVDAGETTLTLTCHIDDHYDGNVQGASSGNHTDSALFDVEEVGLKSVTFADPAGGGYHAVYVDAGAAYGTPQWQDNSDSALNQGHLDGDADDWDDDPADQQYPVCYESGKKLKVTVYFLAEPEEEFERGDHRGRRARRPGLRPRGGGLRDRRRQRLRLRHVRVEDGTDGGDGELVRPADDQVDAEGGRPVPVRQQRQRDVRDAGRPAVRQRSTGRWRTWRAATRELPLRRRRSRTRGRRLAPGTSAHGTTTAGRTDRALHYYLEENGYTTVAQLLVHADGQCFAWASLFRDSLAGNGITSSGLTEVVPPSGCYEFGVKNIGFDDADPDYPAEEIWKYSTDDLDTGVTGIPGQNTPTPAAKLFIRHWIYLVGQSGGPYYDPSYGVTYADKAAFTSVAVAAWGKIINDEVHWCKSSDEPSLHVEFN